MEFFDQFEHTIDDKGRMVLPAAYRNAFAEGGFLAFLGGYAALFTTDGWEKYRRRLELSGQFSRQQLQVVLSYVSPFVPDSQHRIAVNPRLRNKVGLEREVTIVGSGSHAAIYARDAWAMLEDDAMAPDEDGRTIADKFNDLDFL
jgi:MraZ protein